MVVTKWARPALVWLLLIAGLTVLTFFYIAPGGQPLLDGSTDTFMSDGTDPTSTSSMYDTTIETWKTHPERLLYGAVYSDVGDPVYGMAIWLPHSERWLVVFLANFFPLEQLSTAFIVSLFIITGASMFLLCWYLGWSLPLSSGLAIAWAFNCFTIARAKVHGAMVGTYHLPLIFLGLFLVVRGKSYRSILAAALAFLVAATTVHYFLIMAIFLSPFFLAFLFFQPEFKQNWRRYVARMAAAVLPALLFLAANYKFALPEGSRTSAHDAMTRDTFTDGQVHPFLRIFAARPIDYLTGNLFGPEDLNPLRGMINESVLKNLDNSNPHERTNGIRWSILILAATALFFFARGRSSQDRGLQRNTIFFLAFGAFAFWLSLSPDIPFEGLGPSVWLHKLIPKVRVTSRAGIHVHFALLMIVGFFLASRPQWRKWIMVIPVLMILDYPPNFAMPMDKFLPRYEALQREKGPCGVGMTVPFFNPYYTQIESYSLSQRLRGSDCGRLDQSLNVARIQWLWNLFPATNEFVNSLNYSTMPAENLVKLANCIPLSWIAFHPALPQNWSVQVCQKLGWKMNPDLTCVAPNPKERPFRNVPESCIP